MGMTRSVPPKMTQEKQIMRYVADKVVDAASLAASVTSQVIDIRHQYGFAIFAVWTGTPTGVLKMQASPDGINNWADVSGITASPAGAAGSYFVNKEWQFYPYIRFLYTRSSGTGSLDIWYTGKGG
jgi:hypothetical protein